MPIYETLFSLYEKLPINMMTLLVDIIFTLTMPIFFFYNVDIFDFSLDESKFSGPVNLRIPSCLSYLSTAII
jgi:hypothetical protein